MIYACLNVHFLPSVLGQERNFIGCCILENKKTNDKERETDESPDLLTLFCIEKEDQRFETVAKGSSCPPAKEKGQGAGREAVSEGQSHFFLRRIHSYPGLLRVMASRGS